MNKLIQAMLVLIVAAMTQGCMTDYKSVNTTSLPHHTPGISDGFDLNHGGGGYYYGGRYLQPLQLPPITVNETHIGSSTGNRPEVFKSGGQVEHCRGDREGGHNNPPSRNTYQVPSTVIITTAPVIVQ